MLSESRPACQIASPDKQPIYSMNAEELGGCEGIHLGDVNQSLDGPFFALGIAYFDLPAGDREHNLQKTIHCFEAALSVYTRDAFPEKWAMTQNNLGNAYRELPTGDRGHNLQKAIACYEAALSIYTEDAFPHYHAIAIRNLQRARDALDNLS